MSTRSDKCDEIIQEVRQAVPDLKAAEYEDEPLMREEAAEVNAALRRAISLLDSLADAAEGCTEAIKAVEYCVYEVGK